MDLWKLSGWIGFGTRNIGILNTLSDRHVQQCFVPGCVTSSIEGPSSSFYTYRQRCYLCRWCCRSFGRSCVPPIPQVSQLLRRSASEQQNRRSWYSAERELESFTFSVIIVIIIIIIKHVLIKVTLSCQRHCRGTTQSLTSKKNRQRHW